MSERTRTDLLLFSLITLCAFLLRLVYLAEIDSLPLFEHLAFDGARYDEWACEIASGEWLGDGVFFQAPLYPYFLASLQSLFGHDLWAVRAVQALLGGLGCGLVFVAGKLLFSRAIGALAGLLLAFYAPAVFFDGLIQKASLDSFLVASLLTLLARAAVRPESRGTWASAGALLGLLCLTRENALIWAPVVPLWIWLGFPHPRAWRSLRIGLFAAGLSAILLPVGLRNYAVGEQFALTTSQFGANFYIGNNADADGTYAPFQAGWGSPELEQEDIRRLAERDVGRSLTPAEISDYWLERTLADIGADPLRWIALLGRKWMLLWNARELEDTDDFYIYRQHSRLLAILAPFSPFGLLAGLAAAGAIWTARDWRRLAILHALILTLAASVALFFVFGRYRISLVPLLAPLAAAGLVHGAQLLRERNWRTALPGLGVAVAVVIAAHWPMLDRPVPSPAGFNNLANAFVKAGRLDEALATYAQALEGHPKSAEVRYNRANLLRDLGRFDETEREYLKVLALEPGFAEGHNNLGVLLGAQKRRAEAIASFRRALEHEPDLFDAQRNLARALARAGDFAGAEKYLRAALAQRPDLPDLHRELAQVLDRLKRQEGE